MRLFDALKEHGEARRPISNKPEDMNSPIRAKFISTRDGQTFVFEWADTGKYVRSLKNDEVYRYVMGYDDWNLI